MNKINANCFNLATRDSLRKEGVKEEVSSNMLMEAPMKANSKGINIMGMESTLFRVVVFMLEVGWTANAVEQELLNTSTEKYM